MSNKVTKVGAGLIIIKDNKVLMSKRKNAHGPGTFAGPGGGLNYMESPKEAVLRELLEECGSELKISEPELLCAVHWEEYAPIHYIGIGFVADYLSGEAQITEPDKFEGWGWYDLNNLPQPLFGVMASYVDAYQNNKPYIEA